MEYEKDIDAVRLFEKKSDPSNPSGQAVFERINMVGAIGMKMMKWGVPFGAMDKTGWEFDLILLAANIAIILGGDGSIGIQ